MTTYVVLSGQTSSEIVLDSGDLAIVSSDSCAGVNSLREGSSGMLPSAPSLMASSTLPHYAVAID
jgi:hypothetical protein